MSKVNRKRRSNSFKSEKKVKLSKKKDIIETILDKNNNEVLEIIDLNDESVLSEAETTDEDWEEVSEGEEEIIKINLDENDTNLDKRKMDEEKLFEMNNKQKMKSAMLLLMLGRMKYINKILNDELLSNLVFSISLSEKWGKGSYDKLKKLVLSINNYFVINEDKICEIGDVKTLIEKSLSSRNVNKVWMNIIICLFLRVLGYDSRLVGTFNAHITREVIEEGNNIICAPTDYKPSTRGGGRKHKNKPIKLKMKEGPGLNSTIEWSLEVLDEELNWIGIDAAYQGYVVFDNFPEIIQRRTKFLYAIAIERDGYMKDVGPKYDSNWATSTRRKRLYQAAYSRIMDLVKRPINNRPLDLIEENKHREILMKQPIPTTIADLKGHPIYVMANHLLKYEVLYPANVKPVCKVRAIDVYLREHIQLAHTKETWLKEAMTVKSDEKPCKYVKTMMSTRKGKDTKVELWGPWQVEKYKPPQAVDGRVPVNHHGNVDLFQPCMVPGGCVHIQLPDIDKVAARLEIHCVPAMIGWAFTKNHSARPIHDGFVICREHLPVLKTAWKQWMVEAVARQRQKRSELAIKNWRSLIRRVVMRERLRIKYGH